MERINLLIYVVVISLVFALIVAILGWLFITYYRSKVQYMKEKQEKEMQYKEELMKTRSEIQNQTLNHVGRELHDNIGQLLAVAKIYTNSLSNDYSLDKRMALDKLLDKIIGENRRVSHSLNTDSVRELNLVDLINREIIWLNRIEEIQVKFYHYDPGEFILESDQTIIIYRIIQEFISNSLRHSECDEIIIRVDCTTSFIQVNLSDNGRGFEVDTIKVGIGLLNIKNRVSLLGGTLSIQSSPGKGTRMIFEVPIKDGRNE